MILLRCTSGSAEYLQINLTDCRIGGSDGL